jgi:hypothetical protein
MLKLLRCHQGHYWEGRDDCESCPECGSASETMPMFTFVGENLQIQDEIATKKPRDSSSKDIFDSHGYPIIEGFEILEDLGRGPTGFHLYHAKQASLNREVRLEVVFAKEDTSQRAWSSLRSTSGLTGSVPHPHILPIHEAGDRDRQIFYNVREWINGPTLATRLEEEDLPVKQIYRLMELLARAIQYAHDQEVFHRTLEPSKILLNPVSPLVAGASKIGHVETPTCQVLDAWYIPLIDGFGLARRGDAGDAEAYHDVRFIAPEQAWNRNNDIGKATDIYGLGAILYYLLAGKPPHGGSSREETLDAAQTIEVVPPSRRRSVPKDLEEICMRCLSRTPKRRYASAAMLAEDLRRAGQGYRPSHREDTAFVRMGYWIVRQPVMFLLLMSTIGALVFALGVFTVYSMENAAVTRTSQRMASDMARTSQHRDQLQRELAELRQRENFRQYRSLLSQADEAIEAKNGVRAQQVLEKCDVTLRGIEWHAMRNRALGQPKGVFDVSGHLQYDLRQDQFDVKDFLTIEQEPKTQVLRVARRSLQRPQLQVLVRLLGHAGSGGRVSPDGQRVALYSVVEEKTSIFMFSITRRQRPSQLWTREYPGTIAGMTWDPVGRFLTVSNSRGEISSIDAFTGEATSFGNAPAAEQATSFLAWDPRGQNLVSLQLGERSYTLHTPTNQRGIAFASAIAPTALAWHPIQDLLFIGRTDGSLSWRNSLGVEKQLTTKLPAAIRRIAFNADATRMAVGLEGDKVIVMAALGEEWAEVANWDMDGSVGLTFNTWGKLLLAQGQNSLVAVGEP